MELVFTWVDALMIILVFSLLGLMSGKDAHDKKVSKKEQENNDEQV